MQDEVETRGLIVANHRVTWESMKEELTGPRSERLTLRGLLGGGGI